MRLLEWLKHLTRWEDGLPAGSFLPLVTDAGEEAGAVVVHSRQTKDQLLDHLGDFSTDGGPLHSGAVSGFFFDQLSSSAGIVAATVQTGGLVQVVASPAVAQGLRSGA